ncbi:MAG: 50S ribosomal protein L24e [Candidatus Nanoarchaeia archaeon]|nr:50S ribosomal protein L24e [Candidatus Nanoarchaeia archaeon]
MKCSMCSKEIEPGTGLLLIRKDAKKFWFCSSKCEKNMFKLNRDPKKLEWVLKKK